MKKLLILIMILASSFALTACNTVDGVGEDLEETGEAIESGTY